MIVMMMMVMATDHEEVGGLANQRGEVEGEGASHGSLRQDVLHDQGRHHHPEVCFGVMR